MKRQIYPERVMRRWFPGAIAFLLLTVSLSLSRPPQEQRAEPESCTSILVGKLASVDGSTMTSHSCDSGTDRTWMNIVPRQKHNPGEMATVWLEPKVTKGPNDPDRIRRGEIPAGGRNLQVPQCRLPHHERAPAGDRRNDHRRAGASCTAGRHHRRAGTVPPCPRESEERRGRRSDRRSADQEATGTTTAGNASPSPIPTRSGISKSSARARERSARSGLPCAFPTTRSACPPTRTGSGRSTSRTRTTTWPRTTSSRWHRRWAGGIRKAGKPFEFCYAYADRNSLYCRRREWRALSLLAPVPEARPECRELSALGEAGQESVGTGSARDIPRHLRGDAVRHDAPADRRERQGANGQEPRCQSLHERGLRELFHIQRERTIASPTATYLQITQSRSWLPNPIGGLVWLGYDNPATTPHMPFYIGITADAGVFMVDGRAKFTARLRLVGVPNGQQAVLHPLPGDERGCEEGLAADRGTGFRAAEGNRGGGAAPV